MWVGPRRLSGVFFGILSVVLDPCVSVYEVGVYRDHAAVKVKL